MSKARQLRERVTFERLNAQAPDAYGNVSSGWKPFAKRYANLRERTGKEAVEGGALSDVGIATMYCRSDTVMRSVTAADRVVARGITWAIKSVAQVDAKNTMIEFSLEKGVAS